MERRPVGFTGRLLGWGQNLLGSYREGIQVEGGKWKVNEPFGDCQTDLNRGLRPHLMQMRKIHLLLYNCLNLIVFDLFLTSLTA